MISKSKLWHIRFLRPWNRWRRRRTIRNRCVSVISNNCWGGFMMKECNLPFNTPFVGLFLYDTDYIRVLEHPEVLRTPLRFIDRKDSRHVITDPKDYPIGVIGDDIEIHFLHYRDRDEARTKWERRVGRIDWNNSIVKFGDEDGDRPDLLARFDALPLPCKVYFSGRQHPSSASAVFLPDFATEGHIDRGAYKVSNEQWDFVSHANALLAPGLTHARPWHGTNP